MTATERKNHIMEVLEHNESVQVSQLTKELNVSKVTVRTDLDELENLGLIVRTHGGAILAERKELVRLIGNTLNENANEKKRIAKVAASLVSDGMNIIIDSGSTTVHVADFIQDKNIMVITNSLLVADKLATQKNIELFQSGGILRRESMASIGSTACNSFGHIHADILFLGASGASLENGLSCTNLIEADTKLAMIHHATKVVLLADNTKLGRISLAHICDWDAIDVFITNKLSEEQRQFFKENNVEVIIG